MISEFIKWLPLIVTFVAGAFALLQINTNNITNARIKWLETFKQILSDFFSESMILQLKDGVTKGIKSDTGPQLRLQNINDRLTESYFEHLKVLVMKYYLIKLNLNPNEDIHQKLDLLLEEYMNLINLLPQEADQTKQTTILRDLTALSDRIILFNRFLVKLSLIHI